ncbi:MAG TPA: efflux RND transporter periplasmic adaptor subunit [Verrucomicrobiota bacterium]|nr:efflux RND transporter periplasmic adaptor subunit [Verrucomicrobiota bacterium]
MKSITIPFAVCAALALVGPGCRKAAGDHGHDHGAEPKTAQITVWTDRYEVFAEHRAAVAGKPTTFITHVTDLHTLEPRREGMVKFVLRQGDTVAEHPQAAPARAGIYLPGIIFPKPGDWQLTLLVPTDGTNAPVELGTIQVYADEHAAEHAELPAAPEGVSFLKEQQWKVKLETQPLGPRQIVQRKQLPARVRAKPGHSATVTAPVSGQLAAPSDQPLPQPGQRVAAGQLLALLNPNFSEAAARVAEAEAEFTTAKAALAQAEAAYERTKKLAAEQAKSPRELQEAELAHESAKARYTAAAGLLATFKPATNTSPDAPLLMELRAPIAGVLNTVAAGPGEVVSANQSLFTVLNPEIIWIEARVPEANVANLGAARDAAVELPGAERRLLPITGANGGKLISLGLEVDSTTRTVPLIYELHNPDARFRIGQLVTLHVETANAQSALAIPDSALVEEGGWFVAYVQLSGETFAKRELRLGIRDGVWVQVLSGLNAGDRVVTRGAYALRVSTATGAIPAHGHTH